LVRTVGGLSPAGRRCHDPGSEMHSGRYPRRATARRRRLRPLRRAY